jgi:cytochrome c
MTRFFFSIIVIFGLSLAKPVNAQPAELMIAARAGEFETVKALLASSAETDPKGIASPLYFAAQGGHLDIVLILLEHGAEPNAQSNWGTPLHIAARRGHFDVAKPLLRYGADANAAGGEKDNTPLHEAAEVGAVEIGRLLIDHGADVNARNNRYEPPIHFAVKRNWPAFAELLRKSGAGAIKVNPISGELVDANLEMGRTRALECGECHWMGDDEGAGRAGPRLWGVVGRPIASQVFPYSEVMLAQTGSWTFERLNAFLADPAGTVPGSGMYDGYVEDRTERINLIAYLRTRADDLVPLPQ